MNAAFFSLFTGPFLVAFLVSLLVTPLVIKIAPRLGIVDDPEKKAHLKNTHFVPIPRGGGIPIMAALLISSLFFLPMDKHLLGILLGAACASVVGFIDDRLDLSPYFRLLTCFLSAAIVVGAGIGIAFISNPFGGIIDLSQPQITFLLADQTHTVWVLSSLFALVWIAWCMNFIGWAGGVEGQLPGFVAIAACVIAALSLRSSSDITQWPVIILAAITAGAYLGFLPFNFYPQKIMPGYGGKSLAGFLLAVLSILATAKVGILVVVLGIPLADALYTVLRRLLARRSPFWGDRGHLHHRLLDRGWNKRQVVFFYWFVTLLLGILALNLNSQQKFYTIIMLAVSLGGFLLWLTYFPKSSSPPDRSSG